MAIEGQFPKIAGDVIYASEINRFSPKLIGNIVQEEMVNVSGAVGVYVTMGGSILYPGVGSMQISQFMQIQTSTQKVTSATGNHFFRLRISGAGLNITTPIKDCRVASVEHDVFTFNHILTSGAITASGGNIGSQYIIYVEGNTAHNNADDRVNDLVVIGY